MPGRLYVSIPRAKGGTLTVMALKACDRGVFGEEGGRLARCSKHVVMLYGVYEELEC